MSRRQLKKFASYHEADNRARAGMLNSSQTAHLHALAFLYDHFADIPVWIQRLTPRQLEQIARIMASWRNAIETNHKVVPLEEVEKQEIIRAIGACDGDVSKAAKLLQVGKTTLYRKIRSWHELIADRLLLEKAAVLSTKGKSCLSHDEHASS